MIEFTSADIELLREITALPVVLMQKLEAGQGRPMLLSDEEHELLLNAVGEHLATHGFDAAYRPTELGTALEGLIDRMTANPN